MIPITGHTQLTALLGSPVAHSISPLMHNEAFHLLDLDYTYLCFNVNEENLETAVMGLKTCGIRGFNLTLPNKNKIVELLDELSPAARLIGAVNTVVNDNGRLTGYNTDGVGYMQAVRDAGYDVIGKTITIMGAGGAATAICAQAALDGVKKIHIFARETSRFWNRTQKLVENINATLPCQAILDENKNKEELAQSKHRGDTINEIYREDIFVGYRWADKEKIKPLFPFGHGLSYTTFAYGKPSADKKTMTADDTISFTVNVKNTGTREGQEVVQLYISDKKSSLPRPVKELKGFQKVKLAPGEEKAVTLTIDKKALSFFDDAKHEWVAEPGKFEAIIGSSSRDIKGTVPFELK